ncbi:MAG TPA: tetratricopeptide repeat protein, partial [Planctomycetota bacterium]|nr:tetratricopeptide repeat protein [Planctomycetota bacterium]
DRYPSAGAAASDLRAFLEHRTIAAAPTSTATRVLRWARREPLKAAFAGFAATVVSAGLVVAGYVLPRLHEAREVARRARVEEAITSGFLEIPTTENARAIERFDEALRESPGNPEAIVGKAFALSAAERHADAIAFLESIPADAPEASALRRLKSYPLAHVGREDEAKRLYESVGEPFTPLDHFVAANLELARSKPGDRAAARRAVDLATKAIVLSGRAPATFYTTLAGAAQVSGDAATRRLAADALERNWPDSRGSLLNAGIAYLDLDLPHAIRIFRHSVERHPDDWASHYWLGTALLRARDPTSAIPELERAAELAPSQSSPRHNLAYALRQIGRGDDAVREARRAVEADATSTDSWLQLADLLWAISKDAPGAAAAYERACASAPKDPEPLRRYARFLHADAKRFGDAIPVVERALERTPDDATLLQMLGVELLETGNAPDAVARLERAAELRPGVAASHRELGRARLAMDDVEGAAAALRRAVELSPKDEAAHELLVRALETSGNAEAARVEEARWSALGSRSH